MIIEGTIYWAKLDKPRDNWNKQKKIMDKTTGEPDRWGREYSVVIGNLSRETKKELLNAGLLDKVKDKMDDQGDHITFRLDEFNKDGEEQEFKVFNAETGKEWDFSKDGEGLIGNLSKGAVKFNVWKKPGVKARMYPVSLLVTEHVEYEAPEGSGSYEDPDDWSAYVKPAKAAVATKNKHRGSKLDDLDDEIPFDSGN